MSDPLGEPTSTPARWRFAERADATFLYDLAVAIDPFVWRFSRHGLVPFRALDTVGEYAAIVVVEFDDGTPCGFGGLVDLTGDGRCGQLDLHASPFPAAIGAVRRCAPDIVAAAFSNAPLQRLYVERFDSEPDLFADVAGLRLDVEIPEFAHVRGRLATRSTSSLSRPEYERSLEATS